jgi:hypothetical protein
MLAWIRGALLHLANRSRPSRLVQCLHPQWSTCKWSQQWCLTCGARRKCY